MRPHFSKTITGATAAIVNAAANVFTLEGGAYVVDAIASAFGTITLQRLGPDGTTYMTAATALSATGSSDAIALPPGQYRFLAASVTGVSITIARVPGD